MRSGGSQKKTPIAKMLPTMIMLFTSRAFIEKSRHSAVERSTDIIKAITYVLLDEAVLLVLRNRVEATQVSQQNVSSSEKNGWHLVKYSHICGKRGYSCKILIPLAE